MCRWQNYEQNIVMQIVCFFSRRADGEAGRGATEKAQKRVYFLLCFFSLAAYAAPLRELLYIFFALIKSFLEFQEPFSQKRFLAGYGAAPHILSVRGSAPEAPHISTVRGTEFRDILFTRPFSCAAW